MIYGHINFEVFVMNRWFKYIIVSTIMASSIFFLVYYQKGEYKYEVFLVMFILNVPVFFDKKSSQVTINKKSRRA